MSDRIEEELGDCIKCGKPDTAVVAIFNQKPQFICDACLAPGGITGTEIIEHGMTGKISRRVNHWGKIVDLDVPIPGVIQANSIDALIEATDEGIDLAWEEHLKECKGVCRQCDCSHPDSFDESEEDGKLGCECEGAETHEHEIDAMGHDRCGPQERGRVLVGSWKKDPVTGLWEEDRDGDYAAIVGEIDAHVVWSKWTKRCKLCSPCCPGQASLDCEDEDGALAYDLPPWMYGKEG